MSEALPLDNHCHLCWDRSLGDNVVAPCKEAKHFLVPWFAWFVLWLGSKEKWWSFGPKNSEWHKVNRYMNTPSWNPCQSLWLLEHEVVWVFFFWHLAEISDGRRFCPSSESDRGLEVCLFGWSEENGLRWRTWHWSERTSLRMSLIVLLVLINLEVGC